MPLPIHSATFNLENEVNGQEPTGQTHRLLASEMFHNA